MPFDEQPPDLFDIECRCLEERDKSLKILTVDGDVLFIPRSQIVDDGCCDVYGEGDEGTLTVTEWIARKKGLL